MASKKKPSVYTRALEQVQQGNQDEQEHPDTQVPGQENSKTEKQPTVQEPEQLTSETASHSDSQMPRQINSKTARQLRIKATFYLEPEDIIAIDEMQTKRFRQNGKKPEKSELVSEAIQLLSKQENS